MSIILSDKNIRHKISSLLNYFRLFPVHFGTKASIYSPRRTPECNVKNNTTISSKTQTLLKINELVLNYKTAIFCDYCIQ